ncbi:GNAT family N-acetyltransferase [Weissella sp. MSCH1]|uniref:GNAT family N-acetyltransferase n=1 Tax=Weissella sp. MSCH1 TaxID=3383343 RepID=UPI003896EBC2
MTFDLRPWQLADFPAYQALITLPPIATAIGIDAKSVASQQQAFENDIYQTYQAAIIIDGTPQGSIVAYQRANELGEPLATEADLAYFLAPDFWGHGIMTDVATAFIAKLPPHFTLWADVLADNIGSLRVLEKVGFTNQGTYIDLFGRQISQFHLYR